MTATTDARGHHRVQPTRQLSKFSSAMVASPQPAPPEPEPEPEPAPAPAPQPEPGPAPKRAPEAGPQTVAAAAALANSGGASQPHVELDTSRVTVLQPGMVVLRGALPEAAQRQLVDTAFRRGDAGEVEGDARGFQSWWTASAATAATDTTAAAESDHDAAATAQLPAPQPELNVARKNAGRVYDAVRSFPNGALLEAVAGNLHDAARAADPRLAAIERVQPTHLQLWNYQPKKGVRIGWHRDNWWSDGTGDFPVLSLSIGATCRFLFKQNEEDESESVLLESGDALIFGGPCRYILHCVKRIHNPDSAPEWLQSPHPLGGGRLNFTFRYAPEAFGREGEYR